MLRIMSALTFELLSAELADALRGQSNTPLETTVRCTLGRDKVMVLVEYPLDSAQAEPMAGQTLDWLERQLREQFDTAGLPEEAVELADVGAEVPVQLFLKHMSETKPFTMRSFIWKVDDGFDDLFGELGGEEVGDRSVLYETEQVIAQEAGAERAAVQTAQMGATYDYDRPQFHRVAPESEALETGAISADAQETDPTEITATGINAVKTGVLPEAPSADKPVFTAPLLNGSALVEGDLAGDGLTSNLSQSDLEEELVPPELDHEHFQLEPESELEVETHYASAEDLGKGSEEAYGLESLDGIFQREDEFALASEASLDADLAADLAAAGLPAAGFSTGKEAAELTLPGEPLEVDADDDFNLPTLDLPGANVPDIQAADADFFNVEAASSTQALLLEPVELDFSADLDASLATSHEANAYGAASSFPVPVEPGSQEDSPEVAPEESEDICPKVEPGFSSEPDLSLELEDSLELEEEPDSSLESDLYVESDSVLDADLSLGSDLSTDASDYEDYEAAPPEDELIAYGYQEEGSDEEDEDDPVYQLGDLSAQANEEDPLEPVGLIDENEVQRQRELWNQQSRSHNSWIFAGALGFIVVGVLGFVFSRPCTFGECTRLQTAQTMSEEAISSLRGESSLAAVTDSKQQLKRSVGLLAPIPIWSRYYTQAQALLPGYEDQVRSLNYVTEAQAKAYQAAVDSQNPPHPVSTWQQIAADWLAASKALEAVPADSPVRELADRKLTEYRANRATILVRIDAESKAEVGMRQAQQSASLGNKQIQAAGALEDWETALASWESAVDNLSQIPQGTNAHGEAQQLLPEYLEKLEEVRSRTEQERNASRSLFQAKQIAVEAQRAEAEEQWSIAVENWQRALRQLQTVREGTLAYAEAQAVKGLYTTALGKAENNFQIALRFQPIEPGFFTVCGVAGTQKCTYSVRAGSVRLDLFDGYDTVINQSITPPDQRNGAIEVSQLVSESNRLLREITLLSTQGQLPVEIYDAKGDFLARYRPDLNGFTR